MNEDLPKHPVRFRPYPEPENREAVQKERKEYSRELAEAAAEKHELYKKTYTDSLTGLPNRRAFNEQIGPIFENALITKTSIALMLIDIDGLKRTNDTLGHPKGDKLLQSVASAFRSPNIEDNALRPNDLFGRFDGDEYWAVLQDYKPMDNQTVDELNQSKDNSIKNKFMAIAKEIGIPDELHVGLSIGIAVIEPGDTIESFIERADQELRSRKTEKYNSLKNDDIEFEDDRVISL